MIEVTPPTRHGVFHPKLWVLRYQSGNTQAQAYKYRLICLSRNLTFDRSWDTALVLEGAPMSVAEPIVDNEPLCDFIARLPELTIYPAAGDVRERCQTLARELRTVRFELPPGFSELSFCPLGIPEYTDWPFPSGMTRSCVLSPFLDLDVLQRLAQGASGNVLVSRPDTLLAISPESLGGFTQVLVMSDLAEGEPAVTDETTAVDPVSPLGKNQWDIHGLHAKLYIGEIGEQVYIWTGSANATQAAFERNIEFLVRLRGSVDQHGIDAFLGRLPGEPGFVDLLQLFQWDTSVKPNPLQQVTEKLIEWTWRALGMSRPFGQVVCEPSSERYSIQLSFDRMRRLPNGVKVTCRPITLQPEDAVALPFPCGRETVISFIGLSFEALTPFFVFSILVETDGKRAERAFVLKASLSGMPADRYNRLLRSILGTREQVLRLIMLLLADNDALSAVWSWLDRDNASNDAGHWQAASFPLFETLLRALSQDPTRLDTVADLIQLLRATPEGQELIPERFDEIWEPLWQVRKARV